LHPPSKAKLQKLKENYDILKSLRADRSIVITKADKGNCTVILDTSAYTKKMDTLISEGPYKVLPKDPTMKIEKEVKSMCQKLVKLGHLSKNDYKFICSTHTVSPIIYGLPKIHKQDCPLRPIVSFVGSPTYNLSKFLNRILKSLTKDSRYSVKNSADFIDRIRGIDTNLQELQLVSFDVTSLFTKVPIQDTMAIIKEELELNHNWEGSTSLFANEVYDLLNLCLSTSYFSWKGILYRQTEGAPMGGPVSPVVAEIFLQRLERDILELNPQIKHWTRYMDDIFALVDNGSIDVTLNSLNGYNQSIQFTSEVETSIGLPFMDILIYRKCGALGHKVYRKPTHTDLYLQYNSFHHISQKISVMNSLLCRAIRVCDSDSLNAELLHVQNVLLKNGYPLGLIRQKIRTNLLKFYPLHPARPTTPADPPLVKIIKDRVILPFSGRLSNRLAHLLQRKYSLDVAFTPGKKLQGFFASHKNRKPQERGVYELNCDDCPSIYTGETGRPLPVRLKEHLADIKHARTKTSAPAKHVWDNGGNHLITMSSAKLIEVEPRFFHRKFKEALKIRKNKEFSMNMDDGMEISPIWSSLLL